MSMGIMGIGAQFINAAGRGGKTKEKKLVFISSAADPTICNLSCTGEIQVLSTKNGEQVSTTYTDLVNAQVSIQADANTETTIIGESISIEFAIYDEDEGYYDGCTDLISLIVYGDCLYNLSIAGNENITSLSLKGSKSLRHLTTADCAGLELLDLKGCITLEDVHCDNCHVLTMLDVSNDTALTELYCRDCYVLTTLDLTSNVALQTLYCDRCYALATLDLTSNVALQTLVCGQCAALTSISYPATNSTVSTAIAGAITAATSTTGTVYTDSAAAYYSTIETAATAKGWTIAQIPA